MKPAVPRRRATSSMYGLRPRFSWTTRTPGSLPPPGGAHQVAFDAAVALRRGNGHVFGLDAVVVFGNLLGPGVVGTQALEDRRGGEAADGEFLRAIQKVAALDVAMDIEIEEVEQLLREVRRFFALHGGDSFSGQRISHPVAGAVR